MPRRGARVLCALMLTQTHTHRHTDIHKSARGAVAMREATFTHACSCVWMCARYPQPSRLQRGRQLRSCRRLHTTSPTLGGSPGNPTERLLWTFLLSEAQASYSSRRQHLNKAKDFWHPNLGIPPSGCHDRKLDLATKRLKSDVLAAGACARAQMQMYKYTLHESAGGCRVPRRYHSLDPRRRAPPQFCAPVLRMSCQGKNQKSYVGKIHEER